MSRVVELPITVKTVRGIRYVYFTYYDSGLKKSVEKYCGPESDPDAYKKAVELEEKRLKVRYARQVGELEKYKGKKRPHAESVKT